MKIVEEALDQVPQVCYSVQDQPMQWMRSCIINSAGGDSQEEILPTPTPHTNQLYSLPRVRRLMNGCLMRELWAMVMPHGGEPNPLSLTHYTCFISAGLLLIYCIYSLLCHRSTKLSLFLFGVLPAAMVGIFIGNYIHTKFQLMRCLFLRFH